MISKDKKRFTITFKLEHYKMLKDLAKECNNSLSKVLEGIFVLMVLLNSNKEEKRKNEKESN